MSKVQLEMVDLDPRAHIYPILMELVVVIYSYVYMGYDNLPNGYNDLLKIGRYDIQVCENNLDNVSFVQTPFFKCGN